MFAIVKLRDIKLSLCVLFINIFIIKMVISVAPVFLEINKKTVNSAILQLELETKNDKDDLSKDTLKEKKFFDDSFVCFKEHKLPVVEFNHLRSLETCLYTQADNPVVPTPPPNV